MLQYIKIAVFILIPCLASAQSVSISPHSFSAWGDVHSTTMISAEYKMLGLHGIYVRDIQYTKVDNSPTPRYMIGISVMTPRIEDILRGGFMYFTDPFPTATDTKLNAYVEASYRWEDIRIFFRHISNAGLGQTNHGIDYVGVMVHL